MSILKLQTEIGEGKGKQVDRSFEGQKQKIQQIKLRNHAVLPRTRPPNRLRFSASQAKVSSGSERGELIELRPGVLLTLEPNFTHSIEALSAISVLLTRFTEK